MGLAAALALAAVACRFPADRVPGRYAATTFTATDSTGRPIDVLAAGGSITLQLNQDGTTQGRLIIPRTVTLDSAVDANLAGVWVQLRDTVSLGAQQSQTFMRNLLFAVEGDRLVARRTINGSMVTVRLAKLK